MLREPDDGHDATHWGASLERSRERRWRRASAARGRRRRTAATLALPAALALCTGVALASGSGASSGGASASSSGSERAGDSGVVALQRALGVAADGVYGPETRAAVRAFQRRNGLTADGVVGPQTLGALGLASRRASGISAGSRAARPSAPGPASSRLERIARCESGGDPSSVSPSGRYRGKYQFSRETWRSLGGRGDPAAAPEAEQDRRAAALLRRRGTAPWPSCG